MKRVVHVPAIVLAFIMVIVLDAGSARGAAKLAASTSPFAKLLLDGVACPDARTCFVVGSRPSSNAGKSQLIILATHDGGSSWTTVRKQSGTNGGLIRCPGAQQCYALSSTYDSTKQTWQNTLLRTADGGKSWQQSSVGLNNFSAGLDCPSTTVCYTTGTVFPAGQTGQTPGQAELVATRDGGKSWTAMRVAAKGFVVGSVACTSVTSCDLGGVIIGKSCFRTAAILHTGDGGKTWVKQLGECAANVTSLACPADGTCYAGGLYGGPNASNNQLVWVTGDDGKTWDDRFIGPYEGTAQTQNSYSPAIGSFACPSAEVCFAPMGSNILMTADGGATWKLKTPVKNAAFAAIACPSTRMCVAVGWTQQTNPGPGSHGPAGFVARTVDGGKTWKKL